MTEKKRYFAALMWGLLAVASAPARAEQPIEHFTLQNGLEVYVLPNHRVPAVNHTLWFKVGSADDPPGKSGLAHYHEHMMFQGTHTRGKGEYSQIIASLGGRENAFTSYDATGYYVSIDKKNLPDVMALEADRLTGLAPSEQDALKEREVIIEERRARIENNPHALLDEQINAALFLNHPYRIPAIGWLHEMQGLTLDDVMRFHRRYTQPGNAILVLTGDITAQEAKPLAEKYYGALPSGEKPDRNWRTEPPQRAERRVILHHELVKQPSWTRQYLAPSLSSGETRHALPLMVLSHVLGGSKTGRLYQSLVAEKKIATSAAASYGGFTRGPSSFDLYVTPAPNHTLREIDAAVQAELRRIVDKGITPAELARAQTLLKAEAVYGREGLEQMGQIMGWILVTGLSADTFNQWPRMIDAVTARQVQEAARDVLHNEASVEGWLLPEGAHEE